MPKYAPFLGLKLKWAGDTYIRYVDTHRFRKNRTHISSTFSRLHENTLWKGKSASDENIHVRDILIFPVVSFVNFFFRFSFPLQILKFVTHVNFFVGTFRQHTSFFTHLEKVDDICVRFFQNW